MLYLQASSENGTFITTEEYFSNTTSIINGNSTTATQVSLKECLYNFKFGDGLENNIITLKENTNYGSITFGSDFDFECDYRKNFQVDIEIKSNTAEEGKDFKGKMKMKFFLPSNC